MSPHAAADFVRLAAQAVLVANVALIVLIVYRWVRVVPKDARRLLFRHVVEVGVGLIGLEVGAFVLTVWRVGKPLLWFSAPLSLLAGTILLIGLVDMLRWFHAKRPLPVPDADGIERRKGTVAHGG